METLHNIRRSGIAIKAGNSIEPRGIHHTISYAVSFNDTWNHIRNELKKTCQQHSLS